MIHRLIVEKQITVHDAPQLYLDDILDGLERLAVWADMNDLDKTAPSKVSTREGLAPGVGLVDRNSPLGRMFQPWPQS